MFTISSSNLDRSDIWGFTTLSTVITAIAILYILDAVLKVSVPKNFSLLSIFQKWRSMASVDDLRECDDVWSSLICVIIKYSTLRIVVRRLSSPLMIEITITQLRTTLRNDYLTIGNHILHKSGSMLNSVNQSSTIFRKISYFIHSCKKNILIKYWMKPTLVHKFLPIKKTMFSYKFEWKISMMWPSQNFLQYNGTKM